MTNDEHVVGGRGPIDRVLDLAVYAPLGLVLTARRRVPELAAEGRRLVGSQLNAAQAVGRLAVGQGGRQVASLTQRLAERARSAVTDIVSTGDDLDDDLPGEVPVLPDAGKGP